MSSLSFSQSSRGIGAAPAELSLTSPYESIICIPSGEFEKIISYFLLTGTSPVLIASSANSSTKTQETVVMSLSRATGTSAAYATQ